MAEFRIASGREGQFTGVAPALITILKTAAANAPPNISVVEAFSGKAARGTGTTNHPNGKAVDVRLIDTSGNVLPNSPQDAQRRGVPLAPAFRTYEQFAQAAKAAQQQIAPNSPFRWGGYFIQGQPFDLMHFDVTSNTMAGGTWKGGLTPDRARALTAFNDIPPVSVGMGAPGGVPMMAAYAAMPPLPRLRPAQQAAASVAAAPYPLTVKGSAGSGSGASVRGNIDLFPVPPTSIPNTQPMKTAAEWKATGLTQGIDVLNQPIAPGMVPPGVGAEFLSAVLSAGIKPRWDDAAKVTSAAQALAGADPKAVAEYFGQVKAQHPEIVSRAGGIAQQRPELLSVVKAFAKPETLATLNSYMTPTPNLRPSQAPSAVPPTLSASRFGTGQIPPPPIMPLRAAATSGSGSGASIDLGQMRLVPPPPPPAGVPSYYSMATGNQRSIPLPPPPAMPASPSYYDMATGNQRSATPTPRYVPPPPPMRTAAEWAAIQATPTQSDYSRYYTGGAQIQPVGISNLVKRLAPVINQALSYPQGQRTVARSAPTGPGQPRFPWLAPLVQQLAQPSFPQASSGFLPTSAPSGGGYVSSPSTFGGVAYISGAGTAASPRIATNAAGATIRLS